MLGGSEFRLRQDFRLRQNTCTAQMRRRPEGRLGGFPTTVLSIQNIDFNRPFQKERFAFRMSFLEFRPPLATSAPAALTFPPLSGMLFLI